MRTRVLALLGLIGTSILLLGSSRETTRVTVTTSASETFPGKLEVELPSPASSDVRSGRLELGIDLPVGSQIELWRDAGSEGPPWDSIDQSGLLDVWIVDKRTQGIVLFDLTRVLRQGLDPGTMLFRALDPDLEEIDLRNVAVTSTFEERK